MDAHCLHRMNCIKHFSVKQLWVLLSEDSDGLTANDIGEDPLQLKLLCGANIFETFAYPGLWKREDVRCKFCLI